MLDYLSSLMSIEAKNGEAKPHASRRFNFYTHDEDSDFADFREYESFAKQKEHFGNNILYFAVEDALISICPRFRFRPL